MEKSIENIWNEGFLSKEELIAPKVYNLYNKKSKLVVDKLKRTMKIDHWAMIPVSLILGVYFYFETNTWITVYFLVTMIGLFLFNSRFIKRIESVDTSLDSYNYLQKFSDILKKAVSIYTKLLTFVYPFFLMPIYWVLFQDKDWFQNLMSQPIPVILFTFWAFIIAMALIGFGAYKGAVKLVYGRLFSKLKEIIADMEELKN